MSYSYQSSSKALYDVLMSMYNHPKEYKKEEQEKQIPWTSVDKDIEESLELFLGRDVLSPPLEYEGVVCFYDRRWNQGYCWESQYENVAIKPLPEYNRDIDAVEDGDDGFMLEIERDNEVETFIWRTAIDEEEEERQFRIKQLEREKLLKEEKQKEDRDKMIKLIGEVVKYVTNEIEE